MRAPNHAIRRTRSCCPVCWLTSTGEASRARPTGWKAVPPSSANSTKETPAGPTTAATGRSGCPHASRTAQSRMRTPGYLSLSGALTHPPSFAAAESLPRHQASEEELLDRRVGKALKLKSRLIGLLDQGEHLSPSETLRKIVICQITTFLKFHKSLRNISQSVGYDEAGR